MVVDDLNEKMRLTGDADLDEMRRAGSTSHRDIVVERHVLTTRFSIGRTAVGAPAELIPSSDAPDSDVGTAKTLTDFLLSSLATYPDSDHYALILWGHSFELGFGGLKTPGDTLQLDELGEALRAFETKRGLPLDLLGTSTCNYSTVEVAVGLSGLARFLVASEAGIPFVRGWPFQEVLAGFTPAMSPDEISIRIVRRFVESFAATPATAIALTALDLTRSSAPEVTKSTVLAGAVSKLADAILTAVEKDKDLLMPIVVAFSHAIRNLIPETPPGTPAAGAGANPAQNWVPAVDFLDFAHELSLKKNLGNEPVAVQEAARDVQQTMNEEHMILENKAVPRNPHMRGLLLLAPGTGQLLVDLFTKTIGKGSAEMLVPYALLEKRFLAGTGFTYPEAWVKTRWPEVLLLIRKGIEQLLAVDLKNSPPNDLACMACGQIAERVNTLLPDAVAIQ
jgi:hypothetical protein